MDRHCVLKCRNLMLPALLFILLFLGMPGCSRRETSADLDNIKKTVWDQVLANAYTSFDTDFSDPQQMKTADALEYCVKQMQKNGEELAGSEDGKNIRIPYELLDRYSLNYFGLSRLQDDRSGEGVSYVRTEDGFEITVIDTMKDEINRYGHAFYNK